MAGHTAHTTSYDSYFRFEDDNTMKYRYHPNHQKRNGQAEKKHKKPQNSAM